VSVRNTTHGWGALTSAAANGHAEVSQALLAAGADPNAPDAQSYTPLDYVVDYQGPDCALAAMLRAAGGAHSAAVLEKLSEASRRGGARRRLARARARPAATRPPPRRAGHHAAGRRRRRGG